MVFSSDANQRGLRWILIGAAVATTMLGTGWAKNEYKKWLEEEVVWIISRAEQETFKALEEDSDRDRFIEEFWRRRDPTPTTDRNEYKEEHYRRLAFANKAFREGVPGWKTDRGRVYILHGAPDDETFHRSRSQVSPDREIPSTARNPNTIVWSYHQLPRARYYRGEMRLIFQPTSGLSRQSFVLSESKTAQDRAEHFSKRFFPASDPNWMEADVRYKLVMAGPPAVINATGAELPNSGLGEFSKYLGDILGSPGDLLDEMEQERQRRERVRRELAEVQTEVGYEGFEFDLAYQAFWQGDDQWWLPLTVSWDWTSAQLEAVDVYVALIDADGALFDEFVDVVQPLNPEVAAPSGQARYLNSFRAPSGEFTLRVVARGVESHRTGIRREQIVLSETAPTQLRLDGLLLTNRVEVLPEGEDVAELPALGEGIVFNHARLLPSRTLRFFAGSYLLLYFQLFLPDGSDGASVDIKFIRDGEIVMRMGGRDIERAKRGVAEYGSAFSLDAFEPGRYTLQVQAIDRKSRSYQIRRTSFHVDPPPSD